MKIEIDITSEQAENLLFALVLRSKQNKNNRGMEAFDLAQRFNSIFESVFGWDILDRITAMARPIKNVSLKFYDLPPKD